jgi:[ribosomal protein S18]-alanine N-acetyltransferase
MQVKIETATTQNLNELYLIEKQCFDEEAFSKQQINYLLSDYNTISLLAKVEDATAGFVIAHLEVDDDADAFGHIITLNVASAFRRKGVAQALLGEIESMLRQKGISECRLEVRENNAAALELYKKLGYLEIGKLAHYYGKAHGLYLKKNLSSN